MKERSKILATAFVAALCAGFAACGDDSSGGGGDGGETGTVKKLSDLGTCISALEGDRYRVEEMDGDYVCTSGKWTPVSSLGECSDSLLGKVRSETNRGMEGYGESFACAVLDSLPGWRSATETEGALGMACVEGFEGKFARDTSKENSAWVCASGAWREASAAESAAGKICDASSEGAFARDSVKKDSVAIYVCSDSLWRTATAIEASAGRLCTEDSRGLFAADSADKKLPLYVCDSLWRLADAGEAATGKLCTKKLDGDTLNFYVCAGGSWTADTTSSLPACGDDNEGAVATELNPHRPFHSTISDSSYVCDATAGWRKATPGEAATGKLCTKKLDGDTLNWYVCDATLNDWVAVEGSGLGTCDASTLDSVAVEPNPHLGRGDSLFVCSDSAGTLDWHLATWSLLGKCAAANQDTTLREPNTNLESFDSLYVCDESAWKPSSEYKFHEGHPCTKSFDQKVFKGKLCSGGEWREASAEEIEMGASCSAETEDVVSVEKKKVCRGGRWVAATAGEVATGKVCKMELVDQVMDGYACIAPVDPSLVDSVLEACAETSDELMDKYLGNKLTLEDCGLPGDYVWRKATAGEIAAGKVCSSKNNGSISSNGYACVGGDWRKAMPGEIAVGKICSESSLGTFVGGYLCDAAPKAGTLVYDFRDSTDREKRLKMLCGVTANINGNVRVLQNSVYEGGDNYISLNDSLLLCTPGKGWVRLIENITDERDGRVYWTVLVGEQRWMSYPLRYADSIETPNLKGHIGKDGSNIYYDWYAAMDVSQNDYVGKTLSVPAPRRGICPNGYHVPTQGDLDKLNSYVAEDLKTRFESFNVRWYITRNGNLYGLNWYGFDKFYGYIHYEDNTINYGTVEINGISFLTENVREASAKSELYCVADKLEK